MTFFLGEKTFRAIAGDMVFLPRGVPHRFELQSEQAKFNVTVTPAGYDQFVAEVGRPISPNEESMQSPTKEDIERLIHIGKRHDMSFLIGDEWV